MSLALSLCQNVLRSRRGLAQTQVWLGDLRVVLFWFYCDLICRFTSTGQLRYVPLFSPLMFLSGPCHSAFTANLEEKKRRGLAQASPGLAQAFPFFLLLCFVLLWFLFACFVCFSLCGRHRTWTIFGLCMGPCSLLISQRGNDAR